MAKSNKIDTSGGGALGQNPFGALGGLDLPAGPGAAAAGPANASKPASGRREPNRNRGRVEIRRMTGGRGGKTVTVASGFVGIGGAELDALAKTIRQACGCGGTVKDGAIEIQGDQRETVGRMLTEAGFRPVMAGG